MHGPEPYDDSNEEHKKLLELFNSNLRNNKPIYEAAINTWTIRDPMKRKTARENNLNWIEFFTVKEFEQWLSTI